MQMYHCISQPSQRFSLQFNRTPLQSALSHAEQLIIGKEPELRCLQTTHSMCIWHLHAMPMRGTVFVGKGSSTSAIM